MEKKERVIEKLSDVGGQPQVWRKRPVEIRAVELQEKVAIKTREGKLYGEKGDFLIEGIQGEIYPCGREIFFKTYSKVEIDEKEQVILAQVIKKDGFISMRHSKSASQYEVYGFLRLYLEAMEMDMLNGFEADDNFELF